MSALQDGYRGTGRRGKATLHRKIFALLALLLLGMVMPAVAQANECRMADPNSKGAHVDEICWLQLDGVTLNANGSTPLTFTLPDGSTMTFTVDVGNVGSSAGLKGVQAPTWTGSQFSGSTGYYTIYKPNTAALYTNTGSVANDTTVTLRDIHLFGPSGAESTNAFEMVIADGESTNSNEYLDFGVVSGGSTLNLVEWLGASTGNNLVYGAPGSAGVPGTPTSGCAGMIDCIRMVGKSGTANAAVFSTTRTGSPFTVMGQVHTNGSSLQGFAFGVRWGGVRLRKALPNGRLDGSDQFTYRVINVKGQEIINTSTTGAATGNYPYISGQATMVISQRLRSTQFTGDFALTSAAGTTVRLRSGGQSDTVLSGDAASGHSAEQLSVERKVTPEADGSVRVDYVIVNRGVDERGIPGVRIGTVEGNLIETDAYGRFHLEGIDVPNMARGRNFIMKVDPATLPPDSDFTTPNPQVKRITQGIPARFDFGVKLPEQELPIPQNTTTGGPPERAATRGDQQTGGQPCDPVGSARHKTA